MATTIQIDGIGDVEVGDSFKSMRPEQQNAYVDHIRQEVGKGARSGIFQNAPPAAPMGGIMQNADDAIRLAASGMTGGYADKISSYLGGTPLEEERAKTEAARERLGLAGTAAELGGAILPTRA